MKPSNPFPGLKAAVMSVMMVLWVPSALAATAGVTFTQLSGLLGGTPTGTAVYRADLSGLGLAQIQSLTIQDNSGGFGGAAGQFSGFDLDTVVLSTTFANTAAEVDLAPALSFFDFSPAGTLFTAGTQRAPVNAALFGTSGGNIDNAVATLDLFDANSTTAIPGAFGFVSLGDNGVISFNLTSLVSTAGLYLYIGEVGDNGEVAAGTITVSTAPIPEPEIYAMMGIGVGLMGWVGRRKRLKESVAG
jgi:hypothetical protein